MKSEAKNDEWGITTKVTKLKNNDNISNNNGDNNDNNNDKNTSINNNDNSNNNKIIIIVIIKILMLFKIKKRSNQHLSNVVQGVGVCQNIKTIFFHDSSKRATTLCVYNDIKAWMSMHSLGSISRSSNELLDCMVNSTPAKKYFPLPESPKLGLYLVFLPGYFLIFTPPPP